jgi:hypothetical protein
MTQKSDTVSDCRVILPKADIAKSVSRSQWQEDTDCSYKSEGKVK